MVGQCWYRDEGQIDTNNLDLSTIRRRGRLLLARHSPDTHKPCGRGPKVRPRLVESFALVQNEQWCAPLHDDRPTSVLKLCRVVRLGPKRCQHKNLPVPAMGNPRDVQTPRAGTRKAGTCMLLTECARALRTVRPRDGRPLDWLGRRDDNGIAARETLAPGKVYHSTGFAIADWLWGQATLAPLLWALVLLTTCTVRAVPTQPGHSDLPVRPVCWAVVIVPEQGQE